MYPERGTTAEINLRHLAHNIDVFKNRHQGPIIGVVKADAYGHGLGRVTDVVTACDALAVATIEEALQLRTFTPDKRIILLEGIFNETELELALEKQLDVVVHQSYQLKLIQQSHHSKTIDVWLKIDTGMHRLGFPWSECQAVINVLKNSPITKQVRLMTHFAQSDNSECQQTRQQRKLNQLIMEQGLEYSFSNTGAVLNGLDAPGEWVRVGIGLYGISPLPNTTGSDFNLKPVMQLSAKLISIKSIAAGESIGYGAHYICPKDMTVGIVGIGYADGYPWSQNHSQVSVHGLKADVIGRVSMDMMAIDLTAINQAQIGDLVQIWGEQQVVEQVAADLKTIPYTLVCGMTSRVKYDVIQ